MQEAPRRLPREHGPRDRPAAGQERSSRRERPSPACQTRPEPPTEPTLSAPAAVDTRLTETQSAADSPLSTALLDSK